MTWTIVTLRPEVSLILVDKINFKPLTLLRFLLQNDDSRLRKSDEVV